MSITSADRPKCHFEKSLLLYHHFQKAVEIGLLAHLKKYNVCSNQGNVTQHINDISVFYKQ